MTPLEPPHTFLRSGQGDQHVRLEPLELAALVQFDLFLPFSNLSLDCQLNGPFFDIPATGDVNTDDGNPAFRQSGQDDIEWCSDWRMERESEYGIKDDVVLGFKL